MAHGQNGNKHSSTEDGQAPGLEHGTEKDNLRARVKGSASVTAISRRRTASGKENDGVTAQLHVSSKLGLEMSWEGLMLPRIQLHLLVLLQINWERLCHCVCPKSTSRCQSVKNEYAYGMGRATLSLEQESGLEMKAENARDGVDELHDVTLKHLRQRRELPDVD